MMTYPFSYHHNWTGILLFRLQMILCIWDNLILEWLFSESRFAVALETSRTTPVLCTLFLCIHWSESKIAFWEIASDEYACLIIVYYCNVNSVRRACSGSISMWMCHVNYSERFRWEGNHDRTGGWRARWKLNDQGRIKIKEIKQARSRLYRSQILQVNTRWKALAEIYTMHSFAPFSNFIFFRGCFGQVLFSPVFDGGLPTGAKECIV